MSLQLYNHLTRTLEAFIPINSGFVGMYVCGPTVYGESHLGHAKCYITFDIVHRYLEYAGYTVRYVQNITDVGHLVGDGDTGEDKIGKQARYERVEPMQVVETYTRHYFRDMDMLNVIRPDISPRASGHVLEQIELTETLIEKGHAYESNGNVYFAVNSWPEYGKLSRRKLDDLEEGIRLEDKGDKRDPRDFAVWRAATPNHLMQWRSPWGQGFPGWHAECTVMARRYLGLPFDIHGGGLENIFPHNESEIAQSEAAYGGEFANHWLLNNMVTIDGGKMGKSMGNSLNIQQLVSGDHARLSQGYSPMVIRFFILSSHYRQHTDFSDEALQGATKGYKRLVNTLTLVQQRLEVAKLGDIDDEFQDIVAEHKSRFVTAMDNDFNTPQALATLFDLNKAVNSLLNGDKTVSKATLELIDQTYQQLGGDVLGLIPSDGLTTVTQTDESKPALESELIRMLIDLRTTARKNKDYATSDVIRDQLAEAGVVLEDRHDGTSWRIEAN
ncbi:cysteine--tRNA ligase [Anaerolineales bacterium HSG24]|nr:cysteine--tRNA ligase [Anaerolineales bacterium HSG24]